MSESKADNNDFDRFYQEVEKEKVLLRELLQRMPECYRAEAAIQIAYEVANWGSSSPLEAIGILETTKLRYREISNQVMAEYEEEE